MHCWKVAWEPPTSEFSGFLELWWGRSQVWRCPKPRNQARIDAENKKWKASNSGSTCGTGVCDKKTPPHTSVDKGEESPNLASEGAEAQQDKEQAKETVLIDKNMAMAGLFNLERNSASTVVIEIVGVLLNILDLK